MISTLELSQGRRLKLTVQSSDDRSATVVAAARMRPNPCLAIKPDPEYGEPWRQGYAWTKGRPHTPDDESS